MKTLEDHAAIPESRKTELPFVPGSTQAMIGLENAATEIARTTIPVLLTGAVGTGKEMFARRIHELSGRGSFARIACAALTEMQLREELVPNSIPGGSSPSAGTVFLDEIADLDGACQRELLGILQQNASGEPAKSARIISSTTRNLDEEVAAARFRGELYYRLNGVCLRLPPLGERRSDIPALAEHFLAKHAAELRRSQPKLSRKCMELFLSHSWPGNIRELENVVKEIVALNDESLAIAELAGARRVSTGFSPRTAPSLKAASRAASRRAEREMILEALARTRWNRKRAAQELQISYKSLLCKIKQIVPCDAKESERGET